MKSETIKQIVLLGGTVSFPHKLKFDDWIESAKIFRVLSSPYTELTQYYAQTPYQTKAFTDIDIAIKWFCENVFCRENLALAIEGIRRRRMCDPKDLDDVGQEEFQKLINQYNEQFFEEDYGERTEVER